MSDASKNKVHFLILVTVVSLVTALLVFWPIKSNKNEPIKNTHSNLGGDFVLLSSEGPVSLSDYKGKVVVLYFGYAYCPDVCPTSLGLLSQALGKLKQQELDSIQALFISVDPERDTVDKLKKYADAFHPKIKGITGTPLEIADIAVRYGASYMKVELPNSALGYAVDHSSKYYLINRKGELTQLVNHGTSPDEIATQLRLLLLK